MPNDRLGSRPTIRNQTLRQLKPVLGQGPEHNLAEYITFRRFDNSDIFPMPQVPHTCFQRCSASSPHVSNSYSPSGHTDSIVCYTESARKYLYRSVDSKLDWMTKSLEDGQNLRISGENPVSGYRQIPTDNPRISQSTFSLGLRARCAE